MAVDSNTEAVVTTEVHQADLEASGAVPRGSRIKEIYAHPWTQIITISIICFCCPGVRAKDLTFPRSYCEMYC